ncbi:unnamed protein product [Soboliphyme baturini]|uniref:Sin3a_C domain-containing protein n=1 Tax=Soboliphyme baturini TaxID=241478 RepID=A0A183J292_9BILA|nr:unnamed protein product [Soboliphyme baturini]
MGSRRRSSESTNADRLRASRTGRNNVFRSVSDRAIPLVHDCSILGPSSAKSVPVCRKEQSSSPFNGHSLNASGDQRCYSENAISAAIDCPVGTTMWKFVNRLFKGSIYRFQYVTLEIELDRLRRTEYRYRRKENDYENPKSNRKVHCTRSDIEIRLKEGDSTTNMDRYFSKYRCELMNSGYEQKSLDQLCWELFKELHELELQRNKNLKEIVHDKFSISFRELSAKHGTQIGNKFYLSAGLSGYHVYSTLVREPAIRQRLVICK